MMMSEFEQFEIKTKVFEGPLDLLLDLIESRKLLINDLSLAKITDDYIKYVKDSGEMSISKSSHFILIASTLLLIKSKSLLPTLELSEEEEQSIEDLERRLKIYREMKKVEPLILEMFNKNPSFSRQQVLNKEIVFAPSLQINLVTIKETMDFILKLLPKVEKVSKAIINKVISLEEMINQLADRIKQGINMSFKEFSGYGKKERSNIIISFLAMLELVKEGVIETTQKAHYADIEMQTTEFDTPNYS